MQQPAYLLAALRTLRIRDRIFIAPDVQALNIENRWSAAVQYHSQTMDAKKLGNAYKELRDEIVRTATKRP